MFLQKCGFNVHNWDLLTFHPIIGELYKQMYIPTVWQHISPDMFYENVCVVLMCFALNWSVTYLIFEK